MKNPFIMFTLDSGHMSNLAFDSWMRFLGMANNAHTIDIKMRADGTDYHLQADFLKHVQVRHMFRTDEGQEIERAPLESVSDMVHRLVPRQVPDINIVDEFQEMRIAKIAAALAPPYAFEKPPAASAPAPVPPEDDDAPHWLFAHLFKPQFPERNNGRGKRNPYAAHLHREDAAIKSATMKADERRERGWL